MKEEQILFPYVLRMEESVWQASLRPRNVRDGR